MIDFPNSINFGLLDILNANSGAIQALFTIVLVFITGYYAWQTRKTVRAMEDGNEATNRPVVSISLQDRVESVSFMDLCITNAGKGLAREIQFEVVGDDIDINAYDAERTQPLSNYQVIQKGIKALAPGETRTYWLLSSLGRADELRKSNTSIKISYTNNDKTKSYTDEFVLDFFALPEGRLGEDPLYRIGQESVKIRKQLEVIAREAKKK